MRTRFILAIMAVSVLVAQGAPELGYQLHPVQKRIIRIGTQAQTTLVKDGKVLFELVVPANATPSARYAGNEMSMLMGKAFGTKIPVLKQAGGKLPALIVGDNEYAKKAGLDIAALDRDGFYIKTFEGNVIIIGRDDPTRSPGYGNGDLGEHATIFAAYDFLERFLGIRFYFPGDLGTVIPSPENWELPSIDIQDRPDFAQRCLYYTCTSKKHKDVFRPKEYENNLGRDRFRMRHESWNWPCCHGLGNINYPGRFSKTHPEYFAQQLDGKSTLGTGTTIAYCYNSGIKDEIIKDAVSFLKGEKPEVRGISSRRKPDVIQWPRPLDSRIPVFDVTPDDSYVPCQCEKCRKLFTLEVDDQDNMRKISDFMWQYFQDVANSVKKQGAKGYIAAWSYWPTVYEPPFDLADNILVVVCARGPWNYKNKKTWQLEQERIASWGKRASSNIRLWNYWIKTPFGSLYDLPTMAPHAIDAYYRSVAPYICGAFAETEMERLVYQYLNHYVFYKLMWNMETDTNALLEEHYKLFFGDAAGPMKQIYESFEETWLSLTGNSKDTKSGPKTIIPSDYELWTRFYPEKYIKHINLLFDIAAAQVKEGSIHRQRVDFIRREMWQPTVDARETWVKNSDLGGSWNAYATEGTPEKLDGALDDPAWKKARKMWLAAPIGCNNFSHANEVETTVKVLYDKDNFYIGFDCAEPLTDALISAPQKPASGGYWANASLQIFMNVSNDRKGFYQAAVDKNGVITTLRWKDGITIPWENTLKAYNHIVPGKLWQAEFVVPRKELEDAKDSFPANFMRYRAAKGLKPQVYYWYPFLAATPLAPDKWGMLHLGAEQNPSILQLGDFEKPVDKNRRIGLWYGDGIVRDENDYLTGGGSVKLTKEHRDVKQNFPLKPDTEYEVSFFLKLDHLGEDGKGGLMVRFDEYGGNVSMLPAPGSCFRGTHEWRRFRYFIKTSPKCGANSKPGYSYQPYLQFALVKGTEGTAWVDHVEIHKVNETKDNK